MLKYFLQRLSFFFAYLLQKSYRFEFSGIENFQKAIELGKNDSHIIACWHELCIGGVLSHVGKPYHFLISRSSDGDFVDYVSRKFQFKTVRGSSSKKGNEAKNALEQVLNDGKWAAITVDGPRGPKHFVKRGIIDLSAKCQSPILPVGVAIKKFYTFEKSWDKNKLPLPFSKILIHYGPPLLMDKSQNANIESQSNEVRDALINAVSHAQKTL